MGKINTDYAKGFPEEFVSVGVYSHHDRHSRVLKGWVTGRGYGKWKWREKKAVHVADLAEWVKSGWVLPDDDDDFQEKLRNFLSGGGTKKTVKQQFDDAKIEKLRFIGDTAGDKFREVGVNSIKQIADMTAEELTAKAVEAKLPHISIDRAKEIIANAQKLSADD